MSNISSTPEVYRSRYPFDLSHRVTTTLPIGKLCPIEWEEVLPGDTWKFHLPSMTKLTSTFIRPIMDDVYLDISAFFVPLRLLYDNTESVFGDPSPSAYSEPEFSSFPRLGGPAYTTCPKYSTGDYLGLPTYGNLYTSEYTVLPFRAVAKIYNEYYCSQNAQQQVAVNTGETSSGEVLNDQPWSPTNYTGMLPPAPRYKDYFSTAAPAPQKGPSVKIPGLGQPIPVQAQSSDNPSQSFNPIRMRTQSGGMVSGSSYDLGIYSADSFTGTMSAMGLVENNPRRENVYITNMAAFADSDQSTINSLRLAFQMQKWLERDSIYGSRYREQIYAAYGVLTDDASIQIPQFLGRSHQRLNIASVASTSSAEGSSDSASYPVGQYAGTSNTLHTDQSLSYTRSFTEHGMIIYMACIRYKHLYSQGVAAKWKRANRYDFFDPLLSNIGQKAIFLDEIYGEFADPNELPPTEVVFGYQEAWAEYRCAQSRVSAGARPQAGEMGQFWSLADYYTSAPSLLDVVEESSEPFDRVLSVSSSIQHPFIVDFSFEGVVSRVVPYHSTPGYVDHH